MKLTFKSYLQWLWFQLKGNRSVYVLSLFFSGINNFLLPMIMSWFVKEAMTLVEGKGEINRLGEKVVIVVSVLLLGQVLHLVFSYTKTNVVEKTMHQIRKRYFKQARNLPMEYYDKNQQGNVLSFSLQNMQWIYRVLDIEIISFASRALTIFGGILVVFIWQWQIGLVYMGIGTVGTSTALWMQQRLEGLEADLQKSNGRLNNMLLARIKGQREIRMNRLKEKLNTEYENERVRNVNTQYQIVRVSTIGSMINYGVMMGASLFSILIGMYLVQKQLSDIGTVLGCGVFMISNIWAFSSLARVAGVLKQGLGAYGEFMQFMETDTEERMKEKYGSQIEINEIEETELQLLHVDCGYEKKKILNDVCLKIKRGEKIVLIGESGSGKSTLLKVIAGLYVPLRGDMKLMGNQYSNVSLEVWRKNIAYVSQQTHIFPGTIRENLSMSNPAITEEKLWQAIHLAQLEEWVNSLPRGIETVLDEKRTVSGGERQRIAVARAFLKETPLLILDEPTSALDQMNTSSLCETIFEIMKDRMVIIASHEQVLIEKADRKFSIQNYELKEINEL